MKKNKYGKIIEMDKYTFTHTNYDNIIDNKLIKT